MLQQTTRIKYHHMAIDTIAYGMVVAAQFNLYIHHLMIFENKNPDVILI